MRPWEAVIGLEVHVQLATRAKLFSGASTAYGAPPNSQASGIDLGLPGVLPVLNGEVLRRAVLLGLALEADIPSRMAFARKNYFYPDLPKGYQISQLDDPIVQRGRLAIELDDGTRRTIGVTRAHLEEDAGKSLHEQFQGATGIDLNRAGVPLLEVVSEPELRSPEEAVAYLREMHTLVRYLEISDGNMNEGSMRCDANVSVRPQGETTLGIRTEIKNVNSFRFVDRAIRHEIERQIELRERGEAVVQETRLYDADRDETRSMRGKEHAEDYRYFPDPDLLPAEIDAPLVEAVRGGMPELPATKRARFERELELPRADARMLAQSRAVANYFEAVAGACGDPKLAANWVLVEVAGALNRDDLAIEACPIPAERLATLIARIRDSTISGRIAKSIFERLWSDGGDVDAIIEAEDLQQVSDTGELAGMVDRVLAANPSVVEQATAEESTKKRKKARSFLVGEVMKTSGGKANPQQVNAVLAERLDES